MPSHSRLTLRKLIEHIALFKDQLLIAKFVALSPFIKIRSYEPKP